jgi:LuxR family maltose regulon positive regulatory protein
LNPIPSSGVPVARLALLDASAGSGKSSVVRQWCQEQREGSVAWLSLDREDNDPARFVLYLCAAMEPVAPAAAAPVRALLQAAEQTSLEAALTLLLNGIAGLDQPITLVLDDYHEIEAAPVRELVGFLVERLPPTLFLILTTRSDPPLPLARLRLHGRLIEIHDDELRFTDEEAGQFLKERMGLTLTPEMVQRLAERTEGWIAGLQMAALSLQGEADAGRFLDAFTGTDRYLVDYFFEEVLRRLPPELQTFLGQTAFLKRLCAPLCEAVTGVPDGQAMLERLEAAHLFLIPMDRERQWYRYHPLFADVLQARLLPEQEEPLAALQARAAAWYEAVGAAGKRLTKLGETGVPTAGARPGAASAGTSSDLVEPLSERELEVLRLVAAGLRNAEIAAQLFLAVGTVERHIHNLYGKLGVNNRTSAVTRARALGLL